MTNSRMVYPETLLKFDTWDTKELENSNDNFSIFLTWSKQKLRQKYKLCMRTSLLFRVTVATTLYLKGVYYYRPPRKQQEIYSTKGRFLLSSV